MAKVNPGAITERETPDGFEEDGNEAVYTSKDRYLYKLDAVIGSKKGQSYILLFICLAFTAAAGAAFCYVVPAKDKGDQDFADRVHGHVWQGMWEAWTYMADPGTHAGVPDTLAVRLLALAITWFGILFFAVIIGFVVDAIQEKMDALKKGKSAVVEADHTVMLGWTSFSAAFILEIADANSSDNGGVVVVLADRNKQELEAEFAAVVKKPQLLGTKVVFRSGSPMQSSDLLRVSCHTARAVLVLAGMPADEDSGAAFSPDKADAATLRTVLSLSGMPQGIRGHIVAEVLDIDNEPLVRMVGGNCLETLVSHDVIGRLMLMSARQPGLARVYSEILGFDGDEFYNECWPELANLPFGDLAERFPDATPIGIIRDDDGKSSVLLNPDPRETMRATDELIVIAEDDDTYEPKQPANAVKGSSPKYTMPIPQVELILMTGWRRDIRDILVLLDSLVVRGTEVHILADTAVEVRNDELISSGLDPKSLKNLKLVHHLGSSANRKALESLRMTEFTSVMVLADSSNETDVMHSDSHTLATLLLLRDIQRVNGVRNAKSSVPCICEILDSRTQKTIASNRTVATASDFVQSNEMISQILAMIAENRAVKTILDELLGSKGSDLCVMDSARYAGPEEEITYFTLAKRAQDYNEVLVGYQEGMKTFVNPRDKAVPKAWAKKTLVVLRKPDEADIKQREALSDLARSAGAERAGRRQSMATFDDAVRTERTPLLLALLVCRVVALDCCCLSSLSSPSPSPSNSVCTSVSLAMRPSMPSHRLARGLVPWSRRSTGWYRKWRASPRSFLVEPQPCSLVSLSYMR